VEYSTRSGTAVNIHINLGGASDAPPVSVAVSEPSTLSKAAGSVVALSYYPTASCRISGTNVVKFTKSGYGVPQAQYGLPKTVKGAIVSSSITPSEPPDGTPGCPIVNVNQSTGAYSFDGADRIEGEVCGGGTFCLHLWFKYQASGLPDDVQHSATVPFSVNCTGLPSC
jgi:hypothetical protein